MKTVHTFVILAYKESKYLEECIKSVINQIYKSNIIIATGTPNEYISNLAKKYKIEIIVNKNHKDIGGDFDFAIECSKTDLVTIAHQDDIYDKTYSEEIVNKYNVYKDSIILFTDYYEIKGRKKEYTNVNLKIKRLLLLALRNKKNSFKLNNKRNVIKYGNAICCPAVTFNKKIVKTPVFESNLKCNVDWYAWEKLSKLEGKFLFINKKIMGHRIHSDSTTTEIIKENTRTKEDLYIYKKFWPTWIAKILANCYKTSEKNNSK